MKPHSRLKPIAYCIALALAQSAGTALADSAIGVDTALGNALNPPGRSAMPRPLSGDGFDTVRHSPSGQLYGVPYEDSDAPTKTDGGWEYKGGIEVGALTGGANKNNALFRQYKDLKNGLYLNYFELEADKPDSAGYVQAFGGGAGRDDQFYGFQFGRYNDWKVKLFYNGTTHVFTDTYKALYDGTGSGSLTMPAAIAAPGISTTALPVGTQSGSATAANFNPNYVGPVVAAANNCSVALPCFTYGGKTYQNGLVANATASPINGFAGSYNATGVLIAGSAPSGVAAAVNSYLAGTENSELGLVRKKGGASADIKLTDSWKAYASITQEKRDGTRPLGMTLNNNITIELPEPIDYTTSDMLAGLSYADKLNAINLRVSASFFRNNIDKLSVARPFMATFGGAANAGSLQPATFSLYPDNDAYNIKGEYARSLPDFFKGRFSATVAFNTSRQNDQLLAPLDGWPSLGSVLLGGTAVNAGYTNGTLNVNNWNTTAALSQQTANQRIDSKLVDLGLSLKPVDALNVKGKARLYETSNSGGYVAYNPLTGQYGQLGLDGAQMNLVVAGNAPAAGAAAGIAAFGQCLDPTGTPFAACRFPGIVTNNTIGQGSPSNNMIFSLPREQKQLNYGVTADYDLDRHSVLTAALEREDYHRTFRERDKTWEDKLKITYVNRGFELATLRASYEADSKRGSDYNYWPNTEEYPTALPGLTYPTILANVYNCSGLGVTGAAFAKANPALCAAYPATSNALGGYLARYSEGTRKLDQADRDQGIFNLRVNYMPREDLDLGLSLQIKNAKYPNSEYGQQKDNLNSVNVDINFQPTVESQIYGFYSYQQGKKYLLGNAGSGNGLAGNCVMGQTSINGQILTPDNIESLCAATANPATSSTNAKFTPDSIWGMNTRDSNDVIGIGGQTDLGVAQLGVDYTYIRSKTNIAFTVGKYVFSSLTAGGAAIQAANEQLMGAGWQDMTFVQNVLNVNLVIPLSKRSSLHIYDRYENGKISDWHYDGQPTGAVTNAGGGTVALDAGPQKYNANVIGVFFQQKL